MASLSIADWKFAGSRLVAGAGAVAALALLTGGCGRQQKPLLAPVTGVVTLDGKPVAGAGLEFIADAGGVAYGKTDAAGRYTMSFGTSRTGAILGKNRVRITSGDHVTVGGKNYAGTEVFPRKYHADSEQYVEVVAGRNEFHFDCHTAGYEPKSTVSTGGN